MKRDQIVVDNNLWCERGRKIGHEKGTARRHGSVANVKQMLCASHFVSLLLRSCWSEESHCTVQQLPKWQEQPGVVLWGPLH